MLLQTPVYEDVPTGLPGLWDSFLPPECVQLIFILMKDLRNTILVDTSGEVYLSRI